MLLAFRDQSSVISFRCVHVAGLVRRFAESVDPTTIVAVVVLLLVFLVTMGGIGLCICRRCGGGSPPAPPIQQSVPPTISMVMYETEGTTRVDASSCLTWPTMTQRLAPCSHGCTSVAPRIYQLSLRDLLMVDDHNVFGRRF